MLLTAGLLLIGSSEAWGTDGHAIVAYVAENLLSDHGRTMVRDILHEPMSEISSWADEIRREPGWEWTSKLHYADVPDRTCDFLYSRDCVSDQCVTGAILNYTDRLQKRQGSNVDDLKFLVHFVGDIHQPLHVGFTGDKGGNDIKVDAQFCNSSTCPHSHSSLHTVWDDSLLRQTEHDSGDHGWRETSNRILQSMTQGDWKEDISRIQEACNLSVRACVIEAAAESANLACKSSYRYDATWIHTGDFLRRDYYEINQSEIEKRLVQAAARLSSIIDFITNSTNSNLTVDIKAI